MRMAQDVSAMLNTAYERIRLSVPTLRLAEVEELAVREGRIVVNMRYPTVLQMLESAAYNYGNFWEDFYTDKVSDRDREAVAKRMQVDAELFGPQCKKIRCGLLSHNHSGASFYGRYAVTLKAEFIRDRTSLLQDNPFNVPLNEIQNLLRAAWDSRNKLVAVRYGPEAAARPSESALSIVAVYGSRRGGQSFVEAHIWGSFTSSAFEKIVAQIPAGGPDSRLLADVARIRELCAARNVVFSEMMDAS